MAIRSVVILNDFCHVQGGASRVAIDEAVALRTHGMDVTFVGAVGPIGPELSSADIQTICLDQPQLLDAGRHPGTLIRTLWNRQAYTTTKRLLASLDPQRTIVHLHGYTKALTTTPVLAARRNGFTVVCTLHDFFAACPNGAFFDYRQQQPCHLSALSAACALTNCDKRHPVHKAYRVARGMAQRYVAHFPQLVSDYITLSTQSAELLRPYLPPTARFHPLSNIIDIPCEDPIDAGANGSLVVVGRLDAEKGVALAAAAAQRIGMPIVFVGDGPLRSSVEATGAQVTGWLAATEIPRHLAQARCLVFPSLWYETYGLVVDEAAARGLPAIVSDISAAAERIKPGETGWLFRSGDSVELENRMALTRDTKAVRAAGIAAYQNYWRNPSTPARHAEALAAVYEAAISSSQ